MFQSSGGAFFVPVSSVSSAPSCGPATFNSLNRTLRVRILHAQRNFLFGEAVALSELLYSIEQQEQGTVLQGSLESSLCLLAESLFANREHRRLLKFLEKEPECLNRNPRLRYLAARAHLACDECVEGLKLLSLPASFEALSAETVQEYESLFALVRGELHERLQAQESASDCYKTALHYSPSCLTAIDRLLECKMLSAKEERDLVVSLPFPPEAEFFRSLYLARTVPAHCPEVGGDGGVNQIPTKETGGKSGGEIHNPSFEFPAVCARACDKRVLSVFRPPRLALSSPLLPPAPVSGVVADDFLLKEHRAHLRAHAKAVGGDGSPEDPMGGFLLRGGKGKENSGMMQEGSSLPPAFPFGSPTRPAPPRNSRPLPLCLTSNREQVRLPSSALRSIWMLKALAERLADRGDFGGALRVSRLILRKDPLALSVIPLYSALLLHFREGAELGLVAQRLMESNHGCAEASVAMGAVHLANGKYESARRLLRRATELAPRQLYSWLLYGRAFASGNLSDQARSAFRTAARLFKGSPLPALLMGVESCRGSSLALAELALEQALSLSWRPPPGDPMVLAELGVCAFKRDKYALAVKFFGDSLASAAAIASAAAEALEEEAAEMEREKEEMERGGGGDALMEGEWERPGRGAFDVPFPYQSASPGAASASASPLRESSISSKRTGGGARLQGKQKSSCSLSVPCPALPGFRAAVVLCNLGLAFLKTGHRELAASSFRASLSLESDHAPALTGLATALLLMEDPSVEPVSRNGGGKESALDLLSAALRIDRNDPVAQRLWSRAVEAEAEVPLRVGAGGLCGLPGMLAGGCSGLFSEEGEGGLSRSGSVCHELERGESRDGGQGSAAWGGPGASFDSFS